MVQSMGKDRGEQIYQIVWPCRSGHYPWNPLASAGFERAQPVIGRRGARS